MEVPESIRTFDHFPEQSVCPLCGKNTDDPAVLVEIAGTSDGSICQASPVHLWCLSNPKLYLHDKVVGLIYAREVTHGNQAHI